MFSIPPSISHELSFDEVVSRLQKRELVDGLIFAGSGGKSELKPESDYDLLVVLREAPDDIDILLTTIDGRMADVIFATTQDFDAMRHIDSTEANSRIGALFHWIHHGTILYDRTGYLEQIQKHHPQLLAGTDQNQRFAFWFKVNFNLYHGWRMLQSDDETYALAMNIRFLYMLDEVLQAYLISHNIPHRGEKFVIRTLQQQHPNDLDLYMKAIQTTDLKAKFTYYKAFAEQALKPMGGLWESHAVTGFNRLEQADFFQLWQQLLQT